jgi:FKBP-type peptidyl-prolyl cis-trans isomerase FkpA
MFLPIPISSMTIHSKHLVSRALFALLIFLCALGASAAQPTEVTYQDIVVGTGETVKRNAFAVMHFNAWVYDEGAPEFKGHQFADSRKRGQSITWVYGFKRALPGVEKGMIGMREGGKRTIVVPPGLGYDGRKHVAPEDVPANAALIFEVELISVVAQSAPRPQ